MKRILFTVVSILLVCSLLVFYLPGAVCIPIVLKQAVVGTIAYSCGVE